MATAVTADVQEANESFEDLVATLQANFKTKADYYKHLFQVNVRTPLFNVYLDSLNFKGRQSHACDTCGSFLKNYGNLVFIGDNNELVSAIWDETNVSEFYRDTVIALREAVIGGRITRQFFTTEQTLGTPVTNGWPHFAVTGNQVMQSNGVDTAHERMAQSIENHRTLANALSEYTPEVLAEVYADIKTFENETAQRFTMQAEWLLRARNNLPANSRKREGQNRQQNYLWLLIATAPTGYCTPRSSALGALIDEYTDEDDDLLPKRMRVAALARFAERTKSENYQRPTVAPKEGAIDRAEKLIVQLGYESALERRCAAVDEVNCIWMPAPVEQKQAAKQDGVFGALRGGKQTKPVIAEVSDAQTISFAAFRKRILPKAKRIEVFVTRAKQAFHVITTAVHEDARDIFKWEGPLSSHSFVGGAAPSDLGLVGGRWYDVTGITLAPWMHQDEDGHPQFMRTAVLLIDGIQEQTLETLALFPELLTGALHEVRSVIEAHSNKNNTQDIDGNRAQGLSYKRATVRVHDDVSVSTYTFDRWE